MKREIMDEIKKYDTIIIHRHVRPDPDAYGSQGGLAEILKASFPTKQIYTVGEEDSSLHYMRRMDKVEDEQYEGALVIVCDTANTPRISDTRYKSGEKLIKIDHHPNMDPYGDVLWVDTSASSTSEMIYDFYLSFREEGLVLQEEAARLLFAGIVGDTGRFLFQSTTEKTFSYVSELIQYPFSRPELFRAMYDVDEKIVRLNGYVLQHFEVLPKGTAKMIITKQILEQFQATASEASQLVGTLGSIKNVDRWVFFIEEESEIRVRFRSKGPVINTIARKYNGGGHPLAAGASIYNWEDADRILEDMENLS
ncbi:DHH family phosphoesterase [Bacillus massiliglaciei]|uniref:DHH family phosphoesterase n=1 Tax=Bacillus massiliglaciei TaxID=1816693 RepID=UPI000DA61B80|nr:bifunctional oligoribonuclease/PAP phosphatase NrnA [Bacillus massiliglaciei]